MGEMNSGQAQIIHGVGSDVQGLPFLFKTINLNYNEHSLDIPPKTLIITMLLC